MVRTYTLKKITKIGSTVALTIDVNGMVFEVDARQDAASDVIDFDPFIRRLLLQVRKGATPASLLNLADTY